MKIKVTAGSLGKKYFGSESVFVEAPDGSAASAVAVLAGIPESEIGIITQNSSKIDDSKILNPGDEIRVYPKIIGG